MKDDKFLCHPARTHISVYGANVVTRRGIAQRSQKRFRFEYVPPGPSLARKRRDRRDKIPAIHFLQATLVALAHLSSHSSGRGLVVPRRRMRGSVRSLCCKPPFEETAKSDNPASGTLLVLHFHSAWTFVISAVRLSRSFRITSNRSSRRSAPDPTAFTIDVARSAGEAGPPGR